MSCSAPAPADVLQRRRAEHQRALRLGRALRRRPAEGAARGAEAAQAGAEEAREVLAVARR